MSIPAANQTYCVYPSFQGYSGDCASPTPYLLPPTYKAGQASELQLPLLFAGGSAQLGNDYSNADFSLSFTHEGRGPVGQATVKAKVIAGTAIWSCAEAARASLRESFLDFITNVDKLEGETLVAGASRRIALALADAIPAAPVESLFFRYGLSTGLAAGTHAYADVLPGMRLRVQAQASQFLEPASPENGYLPAGELVAEIVSTPAAKEGGPRPLAFDPFLATVRAPTVGGAGTVPTIAGGLVDLGPAGGSRLHWRLFVPQQVRSPSETGELDAAGNFTLLGAPTYAALEAATASYPQPPEQTPELLYAIVLGRAVIVPEISVWIGLGNCNSLEYVPLGTTLANVIERHRPLPLDPERWSEEVTLTRLTPVTRTGTADLTIDTDGLAALRPEFFDVPLAAGDAVLMAA